MKSRSLIENSKKVRKSTFDDNDTIDEEKKEELSKPRKQIHDDETNFGDDDDFDPYEYKFEDDDVEEDDGP